MTLKCPLPLMVLIVIMRKSKIFSQLFPIPSWCFHKYLFNFFVCAPCECRSPQRPEEGAGAPETGVTNGFKLLCERWDLNRSFCKNSKCSQPLSISPVSLFLPSMIQFCIYLCFLSYYMFIRLYIYVY